MRNLIFFLIIIIPLNASATHIEEHSWLWEVIDFWFDLGIHSITLVFAIMLFISWLSNGGNFFMIIVMTIFIAIAVEFLGHLFSSV